MGQLDAVFTVLDAEQSLDLPYQEALQARAQVIQGDLILLNKVDLVNAEKLAQAHEWIDSFRPGVQVFETTQARLLMEIQSATGAKQSEGERTPELALHVHEVSTGHDHDHGHELLFDTWTYTSEAPLQMASVQELLKHLPSTLFRVKGFVYAIEESESHIVVRLAGRRTTVTPTRSWGAEQP